MMEKNQISFDDLEKQVMKSERILLTTHVNPDGDGLGSELAFHHYLKNLGKDCRIINVSPLPKQYEFLDTHSAVEKWSQEHSDWIASADITLIFDIGEAQRMGRIGRLIMENTRTICIDHHPMRNNPYHHTIIRLDAPSTGSIVWDYFRHIFPGEKLPLPIAYPLYAALITDTGSFRYNNTTTEAHQMAVHLLESGVQPYKVHKQIYESRPLAQVKLLGEVINHLQFSDDGRFVWFVITNDIMKKCGATQSDIDGFTDFARSIDGVEISCMLLKMKGDRVRINFRSKGKYTVNDVAANFNGGGHQFAAGAVMENTTLKEAEEKIVKLVQTKLAEGPHVS